jgi:TamB, inner membrane protein subunit of TAM complex
MKKFSVLFLLPFVIIFTCAFSAGEWKDSVDEQIRTETVKALKAAFNKKVTIGSVSGRLVGQVVFNDVVIPGIADVKKIYINYSLIKFAYKKDILPAITKIIIADGTISLLRDASGNLNVLSLVPQGNAGGETTGSSDPPPFAANIFLQNCQINYDDYQGFRSDVPIFHEKMVKANGNIDFSKKNQIIFDLSGSLTGGSYPYKANAKGFVDLKKNKYKINISGKRAELKRWGNYIAPIAPLVFEKGSANLSITLASPRTKGRPLSVTGNFVIRNGSAQLGEYKIENTSGVLYLKENQLIAKNCKTEMNGLPIKIEGDLNDFSNPQLDFFVSFNNGELNNLISIFPQTRNLALSGTGNLSAKITGPVLNPQIDGKITVKKGVILNNNFNGFANLHYKDKLLKIDIPGLKLEKGTVMGKCDVNFKTLTPSLSLKLSLKDVDLAPLSQNTPGIVGLMSGELSLIGPTNKLRGDLFAILKKAEFLGQPIEEISSMFTIKDGETYLDYFSATSKGSFLRASGLISRKLEFDFQAAAQGIELSGSGLIGSMEAQVDSFEGKIAWKLDEQFITSPLKNLKASGKVNLSQGRIGEQLFDLAQGELNMGNGLIQIDNVIIRINNSTLQASGQTGIGFPTKLKVSGDKLQLEDLKILNLILPKEAGNPTGICDIKFEVTGEMSRETKITSFDPILGLNANGEIILLNADIADLPIKHSQINFRWHERSLSFPHCHLETSQSDFDINLSKYTGKDIDASISGIIDFSEFEKFTNKYGNIEGKLGINLVVKGNTEKPNISASFWLEDFYLNKLHFDRIKGNLTYSDNQLNLTSPVYFMLGENEFTVSGSADLRALQTKKPEESSLDLKLKIIKADLSTTLDMIDQINSEVSRRLYAPEASGKVSINLATLILGRPDTFFDRGKLILYRKNGKTKYFLKYFDTQVEKTKQTEIKSEERNFGGDLKGKLSLKGKINKLAGDFDGEVVDGFFKDFGFDKLSAKASLKENKITIERCELNKSLGKMWASGDIDLNGEIDLDLAATRMPLNFLKILFNQQFKGNFNMKASLAGPLQNPMISASFAGTDLTLSGVFFDKAKIAFTKDNGHIKIYEFSLFNNRKESTINGDLYLGEKNQININAKLQNNAIGLFNLFTDDVKWVKGDAITDLTIIGPLKKPKINGTISLDEVVIYVKAIDSLVQKISTEAIIKDNIVQIPALTGIWKGKRTKAYPNFIGVSGAVDLNDIFSDQRMLSLNLAISPTQLYIDLPNLYSGVLELKSAHLYGPLTFDLKKGPTLVGKADINNAVITLAKGANGKKKIFPLIYDLTVSMDKNVYAVMGDVATFDLSNIFMNLGVKSDELRITGTSAKPSLQGKILIRRGSVNIFNREFTLLTSEQQEEYYPFNADKVKKNIAYLSGEEGDEGIKPDVTITAKVDVEESETDASGNITKKKVVILSSLQGVIGASDKERELKIKLDSFVEDEDKKLKPGGYSEQQIKVMLLPDFIKSLTGINKGDEVDTNVVVADYISSRFQTILFRGLERDLEQRLGLESLTLEYNFGKDIRQAMGVTQSRSFDGEKPDWRVGFVKGFFDKFYLDFNYSQANQDTGAVDTYYNYQLTYKLSPIWSIIYYEEPSSLLETSTGDKTLTLKAGFSFW